MDSIGIEPIAAALQVQLAPLEHGYPEGSRSAAGAIRTLTTRGLSSVTLPLVYGGMLSWGRWDLHPVGLVAAALQAASVKLYRQRPRGVADGTCTHLFEVHNLAPRLLRHRPQSALMESHQRRSVIGRVLCC